MRPVDDGVGHLYRHLELRNVTNAFEHMVSPVRPALPQTLDAVISVSSWETPNVFRVLMGAGSVEPAEMYRTFNMGVGIVVVCAPTDAKAVLSAASAAGVPGWQIGSLKSGSGAVILS